MALTSLHSEPDAATNPPSFAAALTLDGYREFFGVDGGADPWTALINSAVASLASTLLVLLLAFPAAYALSIRLVQKWTDVLFFFLSTKMLPVVAGLLPLCLFARCRRAVVPGCGESGGDRNSLGCRRRRPLPSGTCHAPADSPTPSTPTAP